MSLSAAVHLPAPLPAPESIRQPNRQPNDSGYSAACRCAPDIEFLPPAEPLTTSQLLGMVPWYLPHFSESAQAWAAWLWVHMLRPVLGVTKSSPGE